MSPNTAQYYENRAGVYTAMGDDAAAAADLEKVEELAARIQ